MKRRVLINIFVVSSIIILILVLIKTGIAEKVIDKIYNNLNLNEDNLEDSEEYPEFIYETFIDGDGNEISVKMEKRIGTIDGEEVVFYEDTIGSEVIYYNFYKGAIQSVDNEKIVFTVSEECLNADPEASFYEYAKVEDYELIFYFDDYSDRKSDEIIEESIFINTESIDSYMDLVPYIGKYIRVQRSKFEDWLTKSDYDCLDLYIY